MVRLLSWLLILGGLVAASFGLKSVYTTWRAEQQAAEQWQRQVDSRPSSVAPKAIRVKQGAMLARLSIERLNRRWVVIEGASKRELKRGPGHLADSAMPGDLGNCVIAGHRDTQFRALQDVKIGETIALETSSGKFVYRVTDRQIVAPTDTRSLDPTPGRTLTLVTCYPFYYVGPAPKRFVIRAELVPSPDSSPA